MILPWRVNNDYDGPHPTVCPEDKAVQNKGEAAVYDICHLPTVQLGGRGVGVLTGDLYDI